MKMQAAIFFLIIVCIFSCGETKTPETALQPSPDSTQFFVTSSFFREQVNQIFLLRKPVYRYRTLNGSFDSTLLDSTELVQLAEQFIKRDISNSSDKKNYRETIFQDAGTKSYTINYTAVNREVPVQGIDILLDEQTHQVKRIFIRSFTRNGDTSIQERYNWHAFKRFQISRTLSIGKTATEQLIEVKWGNDSDGE